MKYKNRIKEIRQVYGKDLLANKDNWRVHPQSQVRGLEDVLQHIGKVGPLIAWETPNGLTLLDGHSRVEVAPDDLWTVLVLDITTQEEADIILATYDTLTKMAGFNEEAFIQLVNETGEDSFDRLQEIAETAAFVNGKMDAPFLFGKRFDTFFDSSVTYEKKEKQTVCPHCGRTIPERMVLEEEGDVGCIR